MEWFDGIYLPAAWLNINVPDASLSFSSPTLSFSLTLFLCFLPVLCINIDLKNARKI